MANFDSKRDPWQLSPKASQLHRSVLESFNEEDRSTFTEILTRYQRSKNVQRLAESLHQICNTPQQREEIYPLVRRFIPLKHRERFDYECTRPKSAYGRHYATYSRKQLPKHAYDTTRSLPSDMRNRLSGSSLGFERRTPSPRTPHVTPKPARERSESNARVVVLVREVEGESFGFCIRGGSEYNIGLFISSVDEGSVAHNAGLCLGDQILEANRVDFTNMSHQKAVKVIQQAPILHMLVRSVGKIPGSFKSSSCYRWTDTYGNEVSPPSEYAKENLMNGDKSEMRLLGADDERKVNLFVHDGAEIGLKIRGGMEHGLGIFIASVERNSGADRAGIQVGDQILDVNGKSFLNITHEEAVQELKSSQQLVIMLKDVGILPHGKRVYDETRWIHEVQTKNSSRSSSASSSERQSKSMKKTPSFHEPLGSSQLTHHSVLDHSDEILEMKARQVLPSNDQHAFAFYLNEYRTTRLSLTSFLTVLSDLLNTPEKGCLFQEIRSAILPRDLAKFDEWIEKTEHSRIRAHDTENSQAREDRMSLYSYKSSDSSINSWLGLFENGDEQRMKAGFKYRNKFDALPPPPKDFLDDSLDSNSMTRDLGTRPRDLPFDNLPPPPVFDLDAERTPETIGHFEKNRTFDDISSSKPNTLSRVSKNNAQLTKTSADIIAGSTTPTLQNGQLRSPQENNHASSKFVSNNSTGKKLNVGERSTNNKEHLHTTVDNMPINGKFGNVDVYTSNTMDDEDGYASVDYKGFNRTSRDVSNVMDSDMDIHSKHKIITRTTMDTQKGILTDGDVEDGLYTSVDNDEPRNVLPTGNDPKRFSHTNGFVDTEQDNMPVYATVDKPRIAQKETQNIFLDENEVEIAPPIPDRLYLEAESTSDNEENLPSPSYESERNRQDSTSTNIKEKHNFVSLKSNQMDGKNEVTSATVETNIASFPERLQKFKGKSSVQNGDGNAVPQKLKKGKKRKSKSNVVKAEGRVDYSQPFVVELTKHSSNLGLSVSGGTDTDSKEIRIKSIKNEDTVAGSCPLLQPGQIILGVDEKSLQNVTSGIAAMAIRQAFNSDKTVFKLILRNDSF